MGYIGNGGYQETQFMSIMSTTIVAFIPCSDTEQVSVCTSASSVADEKVKDKVDCLVRDS